MAYDIIGARQAGVPDEEIIAHLAEKQGYKLDAAREAGVPDTEILSHLLSKQDVGAHNAPAPAAAPPQRAPMAMLPSHSQAPTMQPLPSHQPPPKRGALTVARDNIIDTAATLGSAITTPVRMIGEGYRAAAATAGTLSAGKGLDQALAAGAESMQSDEQKAVWHPETPAGQFTEKAIAYPFQKWSELGDYLVGDSGNPTLDAAKRTAWEFIPFTIGGEKKASLKKIQESDWWRTANVKERGLVVQSVEDAYDGMKAQGLSEAEIAKKGPEYFQEALRRRIVPESKGEATPTAAKAAATEPPARTMAPRQIGYEPPTVAKVEAPPAPQAPLRKRLTKEVTPTNDTEQGKGKQETPAETVQPEDVRGVDGSGRDRVPVLQSTDGLRPAVRTDAETVIGEPGSTHPEIIERNDIKGEPERGFVGKNEDGTDTDFMNRAEAKQYMKEKHPDLYAEWVKVNGEGAKGELHSQDLNTAEEAAGTTAAINLTDVSIDHPEWRSKQDYAVHKQEVSAGEWPIEYENTRGWLGFNPSINAKPDGIWRNGDDIVKFALEHGGKVQEKALSAAKLGVEAAEKRLAKMEELKANKEATGGKLSEAGQVSLSEAKEDLAKFIDAVNKLSNAAVEKVEPRHDYTRSTPNPVKVMDSYGKTHYVDRDELASNRQVIRRYNSKGERLQGEKSSIHRANIVDQADAESVAMAKRAKRLSTLEKKAEKGTLTDDELQEAKGLQKQVVEDFDKRLGVFTKEAENATDQGQVKPGDKQEHPGDGSELGKNRASGELAPKQQKAGPAAGSGGGNAEGEGVTFPHQAEVYASDLSQRLEKGGLPADHPLHDELVTERRQRERQPDGTTGLIAREHHNPTLERAHKVAQDTGQPFAYADVDLANLGGLNEHMGADAAADPHVKGMLQIVDKVVREAHPDAQVMRKGGDEFAVFAPGVSKEKLDATLAKAQEAVTEYTKEHGLDKISRKRPETAPYGTGIHFGTVDLGQYETAESARLAADALTEIDKQARKEAHYVNQGQAGKAGALAPEGQAGGTESRAGEEGGGGEEETSREAVKSDIVEAKHAKTGEPTFVVKVPKRVDRDVYDAQLTAAKELGGWYSSYRTNGAVPGFQFKTMADAESFQKYLSGANARLVEMEKPDLPSVGTDRESATPPSVYYRGKTGDTGHHNDGATWYTPDRKYAEQYGEVTEHKIDPKNTYTLNTPESYSIFTDDPKEQKELADMGISHLTKSAIKKLREGGYDSVRVTKEAGVPKGYMKGESLVMLPETPADVPSSQPVTESSETAGPAWKRIADAANQRIAYAGQWTTGNQSMLLGKIKKDLVTNEGMSPKQAENVVSEAKRIQPAGRTMRYPSGQEIAQAAINLGYVEKTEKATDPLRMDGTPRPEKTSLPGYASLPEATRTKFEAAWDGKDIPAMQEYIHPDNKNLRAEWEHRTGENLPKTVKGTRAAVEEYFTRVGGADADVAAYEPRQGDIVEYNGERKAVGFVYGKDKWSYHTADEKYGWVRLQDVDDPTEGHVKAKVADLKYTGVNKYKPDAPEVTEARANYEAARVTGPDTPAEVVKEAVKTAKGEGTPLKEQKKYLLANIEDAIKDAPEAPSKEIMKLQNELDELRKSRNEAHGNKADAEMKLKYWRDETFSSSTSPEVRQERVNEFQAAYDVADADGKRIEPLIKQAQQSLRDADAYVTIDVPDDGTFEVYNSKNALQNFKKQVETLFPSAEKAPAKATGYGNLPKQTTVKAPPLEGAGVFTGDMGTWHGTGHLMVKGEPQIKIKPSKDKTVNERNEAWKADPPDISRVLPDKKNLDRVENIDFVGHGAAGAGGKNGEVLAVSGNPIDTADKAYARLRVEGKPDVYVDQDYFLYAKQHYPNAEIYADGNKQGPVLFYENGGPVAVVMPVREHTLSAEMKALEVPRTGQHRQTTKGTELYDITSIVPLALKELGKLAKAGRDAMPHLEALGRAAFEEGHTKYQDFTARMKAYLGDLWDRFKGLIQATWERVKKFDVGAKLREERGSVSNRDLRNALIDQHNAILDKAEAAAAAGNEPLVQKLLQQADALALQIEPERAPEPITMTERPTSQQRTTSLKNAVVEDESGPQERAPFTRQELVDIGKRRIDNDPLYDPRKRAAEIVNNPQGAVSFEDFSSLLYDRMRIGNEYEAMRTARIKATESGDKNAMAQLDLDLARLEEASQVNAQAAVHAKTWNFSAMGHLSQAYMTEDYSALWLKTRASAIKGVEKIPADLKAKLDASASTIADLQKKLDEAEKREAEARAQKAVQAIKNELDSAPASKRRQRQAATKESRAKEYKNLSDRLKVVLSPLKLHAGLDPEAVVILKEMARLRVMDGITKAKEIVDDIYDELKDDYAIEHRDIQDAISGYGKTYSLSADEVSTTLREVNRQLKLMSALEDAQAGVAPAKSGIQHDPVSDEVRDLRNQVRQAMKESGIDDRHADPEHQWKTSLDAAKTRLKNEIHDLNRQIETGKRDTVKKSGVHYDAEALALKERRDALKAVLDGIDAKPGVSDERKIEIIKDGLERSIEAYRRQIATGDVGPSPKPVTIETPEIKKLRDERDSLRKIRDEKRAFKLEMQKKGVPDEDPQITALNKFMEDTERRIKAKESALDRAIAEDKRKIAENDLAAKKPSNITPETPAIRRKQSVLDGLKKTLDQMRKDAKPPKEPKTQEEKDAIMNRAYRTRLEKRKAELQEMQRTGDFSKSARRSLPLDSESQRLKAEVELEKDKVEAIMHRLKEGNRSLPEKIADRWVMLNRFWILSGSNVLAKITASAALTRPGFSTAESAVGSFMRHVPLLSDIYEGAPRHGQGLSVRAEAAAYSNLFRKRMYREIKNALVQGKTEIALVYGKKTNKYMLDQWGETKGEHISYILKFPGRLHGAIKSVAYVMEFDKSVQLRFEDAIRKGQDISDPVWQFGMMTLAEGDAQRAIFMQDSAVVSMVKAGINTLKREGGTGGLAAATAIKLNIPIMKIPANITGEMLSYVPPVGLIKAGATLANGYVRAGKMKKAQEVMGETLFRRAVAEMTEKEKEYFAMTMNKAALGTLALTIIGWYLYDHFGGLHTKNEPKRKYDSLKPEEVKIFNTTFGPLWGHHPAMEYVQSVATLRQLMEARRAKGEDAGPMYGLTPVMREVAEQVPVIGTPVRAIDQKDFIDYELNQLSPVKVPQFMREIAKKQDTVKGEKGETLIPRKTTGLIDNLKSGIPGQRQKLPIDTKKLKNMPLDQLAEIMENADWDVAEEVKPIFQNKFLKSRDLSEDERDRYREILRR